MINVVTWEFSDLVIFEASNFIFLYFSFLFFANFLVFILLNSIYSVIFFLFNKIIRSTRII